MKKFFFYFLFVLFGAGIISFGTGCADDPATIPAYIKIDTIMLDSTNYDSVGSTAHKISFAWVYMDDNLQGVYLLPAKFPVIGEGVHDFRIFAGVYDFGNGQNAMRYPFFLDYRLTDTLVAEDTLVLTPHVTYDTTLLIKQILDFDVTFPGNFNVTTGSADFFNNHAPGFEGQCGYLHLSVGSHGDVVTIEGDDPVTIPKGLPLGVFIELNYKCNAPFYFDIKTSLGTKPIIGFNTKTTWNKAYINITTPNDLIAGSDVRLVFRTARDTSIADQEIFLDNIKVVFKQ